MARGTIVTRVQKDGTKRYATVIWIGAKQRWKTFAKKGEAEAYLDKNSTDVREGTYRELKKATFEEYVEKWKPVYLIPAKLKPATLNGYGSNIKRHLVPAFGLYQLTAIDTEAISAFEAKLLTGGQSVKSTRNIIQLLNRILEDARRDGYLRISPMVDMTFAKLEKKEKRALTKDEVAELLNRCGNDETLRLVVLIGLLAGLRRNEIFALSWEDIDPAGNVIQVRKNLFWRLRTGLRAIFSASTFFDH